MRVGERGQPPGENERSALLLVSDGDDGRALVRLELQEVSDPGGGPEGLGPREVGAGGSVRKGVGVYAERDEGESQREEEEREEDERGRTTEKGFDEKTGAGGKRVSG